MLWKHYVYYAVVAYIGIILLMASLASLQPPSGTPFPPDIRHGSRSIVSLASMDDPFPPDGLVK